MILPVLALSLSLWLPGAQSSQKTPDFSGTWTEDSSQRTITPTPDADATSTPTAPSTDVVIRQTRETLTRESPFMSRMIRYVYRLDGTESVNRNGADTLTTRSRWEGPKLISRGTLYSETSAGESSWQVTETQWLNAKGHLVIETTSKDDVTGKVRTVIRVWTKKS